MLKKKRGLGSLGVDVLLSAAKTENAITSSDANSDKSLQSLPIDLIHQSPYQPRQVMEPEALEELASSIRQQGVVQPIVVRKAGDEYELIAGERRWRASQQAGLQNIPAVVKNVNDQEAAAIAIIENLQREDLNPVRGSSSVCEFNREVWVNPSRGRRGSKPFPRCGEQQSKVVGTSSTG